MAIKVLAHLVERIFDTKTTPLNEVKRLTAASNPRDAWGKRWTGVGDVAEMLSKRESGHKLSRQSACALVPALAAIIDPGR
jgi:hypothetical protein